MKKEHRDRLRHAMARRDFLRGYDHAEIERWAMAVWAAGRWSRGYDDITVAINQAALIIARRRVRRGLNTRPTVGDVREALRHLVEAMREEESP